MAPLALLLAVAALGALPRAARAQSIASPMRFARFAPASAPFPRAYGAVVTNATSVVFSGGRTGSTPAAASLT